MAVRNAITIRYYLWADDGPWRLPVRLHQDLIAKKVALPQYAGTKQKILEVFARWITRDTYSLRGGAASTRSMPTALWNEIGPRNWLDGSWN